MYTLSDWYTHTYSSSFCQVTGPGSKDTSAAMKIPLSEPWLLGEMADSGTEVVTLLDEPRVHPIVPENKKLYFKNNTMIWVH